MMPPKLRRLHAWRPGKLAKGTLAMTAGLGLRTLGQAAVFLIVARVLGVEAYGAYSAVLALAMTLGSFAGLGTSYIMLRETARDVDAFTASWGRTLASWIVTAPVLFGFYLILAWVILPEGIGWVVVGCIGAAEILLAPLTMAVIQSYQGHERNGRAAHVLFAPVLPRLTAVAILPLVLIFVPAAQLPVWAVLYLLATALATVYTLRLLHRDFGLRMSFHWHRLARVLHQGWPFAVGGAAEKMYVDIDKIMLARLTTLEITGAYSAAYRVVGMANVPLMAFFASTEARFFRTGGDGVHSAARYAWRLLPLPLLYALTVSISLFLLASLMPRLLGPDFLQAVEALRWLAWLPLVSLPRTFLHTIMLSSDRQRMPMYILLMGMCTNAILNIWWIPLWSWKGAVLATYVTELLTIVFMLTWLLIKVREVRVKSKEGEIT